MIEPERIETETDVAATAHRMFHLLLEVLGPLGDGLPTTGPQDKSSQLEAILSSEQGPLTLNPVSDEEQQETLHTWQALNGLFERLGPARVASVEQQTDLQQLPQDVLQAIELHLDDDRLTNLGKILAISHLLLGQTYPNQ